MEPKYYCIMAKRIALENVNELLLNNKINEYIVKNGLMSTEDKCRLVKMTLRYSVPHFPTNIPFIAAVKNCNDGMIVVFNIHRSKMAVLPGNSVSSETKVGKRFTIARTMYEEFDKINGFRRYKPHSQRHARTAKFRLELEVENSTSLTAREV